MSMVCSLQSIKLSYLLDYVAQTGFLSTECNSIIVVCVDVSVYEISECSRPQLVSERVSPSALDHYVVRFAADNII